MISFVCTFVNKNYHVPSFMIELPKIWALQMGILLLPLGLLGCGSLGHLAQSRVSVSITNIADIQKNRDSHPTVYLKGKVAGVAAFVGSGAYELQDTTSSIWVVTKQPLPAPGDEVLVKSQVQYQSIPIGGKDLGEVYAQEQEQLERQQGQKKQ